MTRKGHRFDWSDEEIACLTESFGIISLDDIGRRLGVSSTTVRMKAIELGLEKKSSLRYCKWTDKQIEYLKENYPTEPLSDLSLAIGFSYGTIQRKAQELGLKRAEDYDRNAYNRRYTKKYRNIV